MPRLAPTRRLTLLLATLGVLAAALLAACEPEPGVRIVAVTATPAPGTAPIAATGTPGPGGTATPQAVELPSRPENPLAGGIAVARYLGGGSADLERCLPNLVHAWELVDVEGPRCLAVDFDGDGRDEFVFLVTVPEGVQPAGDIWFFEDAEGGHRLLSSARALANAVLQGVEIVGATDLTGDGVPEVVIIAKTCGAHTCLTHVIIASHHRGMLENLAPDGASIESLESIELVDAGDGQTEIVMRGGVVGSVGAGPQRALTRTLSWTGLRFARVDRAEEAEYLIHLIADADAAYRMGDLTTAMTLYRRAATDTTLRDWKAEIGEFVGRREIIPYAWFRAALTAQRQGDPTTTREMLGRAAEHTSSMHGISAGIYLAALNAGRTPSAACSDVEQYLTRFADAYQRFWDYGYANPEHTISGLCR
jgi:hypothetical protein